MNKITILTFFVSYAFTWGALAAENEGGDRTGGGGMNYVELPGGQMMPLPFWNRVQASRNKKAPKPVAVIPVPLANQEAGKPKEVLEPSICRVNDSLNDEDFKGGPKPDPKEWRAQLNGLLGKIFELSPLHAHQLFENAKRLQFKFSEIPDGVKIYTTQDDGYVEIPQNKKKNCDYQKDGVVTQNKQCWLGNFTANAELNITNPYVFMLQRAFHELWEPSYRRSTMKELDELLLEIFAYAELFDLGDSKKQPLSPTNAIDRFMTALNQSEASLGSNENPMRFGRNFVAYSGTITKISIGVADRTYPADKRYLYLNESGIDVTQTYNALRKFQAKIGYSIGLFQEGNNIRVTLPEGVSVEKFAPEFETFMAAQGNQLVFESNSHAIVFTVDVASSQKALALLKTKPELCQNLSPQNH